ncbi:hypothetical protein BKD26_19395 [Streptomyces sp. CB03238]|nr:hypothetical protein BKD26_19395 [Streptomyces sp. CB03238]
MVFKGDSARLSLKMWHLTATGATPAPVLQTRLHHLAEDAGVQFDAFPARTPHSTLARAERNCHGAVGVRGQPGAGRLGRRPPARHGVR